MSEAVMIKLGSIVRHDVFAMDGKVYCAMCDAKAIDAGNVQIYVMQIPAKKRGDWERSIVGHPALLVEAKESLWPSLN
jgi:hypothetical protein